MKHIFKAPSKNADKTVKHPDAFLGVPLKKYVEY